MRRIEPHSLWIGNVLDVSDLRSIHEAGIKALIDLAVNEPVSVVSRELVYCRFPIVDGHGNAPELLNLAVQTTARLVESKVPTLVFCSAGMSRSPCVAALAIAIVTGDCPQNCLFSIAAGGPADVAPTLWSDLLIAAGTNRK